MLTIRVDPCGDQWVVTREGIEPPLSTHETEANAVAVGRAVAMAERVHFELHDQDGRLRLRNRYEAMEGDRALIG